MSNRHAAVTEFDRWVGANNIPERFEYGKGWWDYVYRDPAEFTCEVEDEWDVAALLRFVFHEA